MNHKRLTLVELVWEVLMMSWSVGGREGRGGEGWSKGRDHIRIRTGPRLEEEVLVVLLVELALASLPQLQA